MFCPARGRTQRADLAVHSTLQCAEHAVGGAVDADEDLRKHPGRVPVEQAIRAGGGQDRERHRQSDNRHLREDPQGEIADSFQIPLHLQLAGRLQGHPRNPDDREGNHPHSGANAPALGPRSPKSLLRPTRQRGRQTLV